MRSSTASPRKYLLIMALPLINCTQIPGTGEQPVPGGTFLSDDSKNCLVLKNSGVSLDELGNGALSEVGGTLGLVTTDDTYSSSSIWALSLKSQKLCLVSQGESGDVWIGQSGSDVAVFSRRSPQLNFSVFTPYGRTVQQATPFAGNGDPQVLRSIASEVSVEDRDGPTGRWLLALNTAGKIVEMDPVSPGRAVELAPEVFQSSRSNERNVFRPADLMIVKGWELDGQLLASSGGTESDDYLLALHQGLDSFYQANGSQAIYAWRRVKAGTYQEVDLNPYEPGINPLPLKTSNPSGFIRSGDHLAMVGLCFSVDGLCRAGVESIHISELGRVQQTSLRADFSMQAIFSNGYLVGGIPTGTTVMSDGGSGPDVDAIADSAGFAFASVRMASGKKIVSIDLENGNLTTIHSFSAEGSGFYGLQFDQRSSTLLVGDTDGKSPVLKIYGIDEQGRANGRPAVFDLGSFDQAVPLQLVVLPGSN